MSRSFGAIDNCIMFFRRETAFVLWRAVCGKTACTVRREGRLTPAPTPIKAAFGVRKLACALTRGSLLPDSKASLSDYCILQLDSGNSDCSIQGDRDL